MTQYTSRTKPMIEFITLFLGLLTGPHPVELAAGDAVAAVELSLDGRQIARLEGSPWSTNVDLGPELVPHRLEAQAFSAAGRPLERARLLINYSSSSYAAAIALDPARGAPARTGRIVWQAVLDRRPTAHDARFDRQPLVVDTAGRFTLPPHDPGERHAIEVTLTFKDGRSVHADLTFGGGFSERVTSSLTAVPITSPAGRPWSADETQGWLERDGEPLVVFAASAEPGTLLLLRDEDVVRELGWLHRRLAGRRLERAEPEERLTYSIIAVSPRPVAAHEGTFKLVELGMVDRLFGLRPLLISDAPLVARGEGKEKLRKRGGQKLWGSLAVAGLNAAASGGPRAALLLLGVETEDESLLTASQAVSYLTSVHVPLYVWTPLAETLERLELGETVRTASGLAGLDGTIRRIAIELASQTVVWVEGEHLPAEVSLAEGAPPEVELVR